MAEPAPARAAVERYLAAVLIGAGFSLVLLVFAWNHLLSEQQRDFAFALSALQARIESELRLVQAIAGALAAIDRADAADAAGPFAHIATRLIERHAYVRSVARLSAAGDPRAPQISASIGALSAADWAATLVRAQPRRALLESPAAGDEAQFLIAEDTPASGATLLVLQPRRHPSGELAGREGVVAAISTRRLLDEMAPDRAAGLALFAALPGSGERHLLVQRAPDAAPADLVDVLERETVMRLAPLSLHLEARRPIAWRELKRGFPAAALLLGFAITLLLVAFARAKDLQARGLRDRNRLVEGKVREQTLALAEARDEALQASRAKSDFLASMSHEIRTPLNAIFGMGEALAGTQLDDEQRRYVDVLRHAGEALLDQVSDILDLSKIEADELILEHSEFDLWSLAEQALEMSALAADGKGLDLVGNIDADVPRRVTGDPNRLRQILLNLVGNALKFTATGTVTLTLTRDAAHAGDWICCEVADTGIGIPADKLDTIFDKFTQADASTTRQYGGTGLGLAICRRLVEKMGGAIHVASAPGGGSRFWFSLPIAAPVAFAHPLLRSSSVRMRLFASTSGGGAALRRFLAQCRFSIHAADAIAIAVRDDAATAEEVIVVDDSVGLDALVDGVQALRARDRRTPILCLLQPLALQSDGASLASLPATRVLSKPFERSALLDAVEALVKPVRPAAGAAAAAGTNLQPRSARILLVEDNADNRLLVRAHLRQLPYELVEALDGREGIARFKAADFDLVLMDVQMPGMDGHAATRAIRDWERAQGRRRTPIVALSANALQEDIARSRAAGCDAHLTKPIRKQILIDTVAAHVAA